MVKVDEYALLRRGRRGLKRVTGARQGEERQSSEIADKAMMGIASTAAKEWSCGDE